jgi:hypothetical protein
MTATRFRQETIDIDTASENFRQVLYPRIASIKDQISWRELLSFNLDKSRLPAAVTSARQLPGRAWQGREIRTVRLSPRCPIAMDLVHNPRRIYLVWHHQTGGTLPSCWNAPDLTCSLDQ